jgi:hypothetical protein
MTNQSTIETIWVDPSTGEIVDPEEAGERELVELEGRSPSDPDPEEAELEELGDYLSRHYMIIQAEVASLKEQCRRRVSILEARRRHLSWQYEPAFERLLTKSLQGGKKKSRDFSHGRAGFRTSKRIEVSDPEAALGWASMNCNEAIKRTSSLIKSKLPVDMIEEGGVPGVERIQEQKFYLQPTKGPKT